MRRQGCRGCWVRNVTGRWIEEKDSSEGRIMGEGGGGEEGEEWGQ